MFIDSTNIDDVCLTIKKYINNNVALISIGENIDIEIDTLITLLNAHDITFYGGIFPKIIHNNTVTDKGIVVNTLYDVQDIQVIKNISKSSFTIPTFDFNSDSNYTLITYVDGLTSNISSYLGKLYETYGMKINYFGGGAGSLSLQQQPCVFSNEGFFEDAAIFGIMKMKSTIGVRHGWEKIAGPFIITKAQGNVIKEINWEKPFDIYKKVVSEHAGKEFTEDNFFDIAKGYPFGILKENGESVVRDPLQVNDKGELICVGELEENTLVNILYGKEEALITAAKEATLSSLKNTKTARKAIIIDCISRILFLEDNFQKEIDIINTTLKDRYSDISVGGALTLGEISSTGDGYLEFYNKTTVVGLFE